MVDFHLWGGARIKIPETEKSISVKSFHFLFSLPSLINVQPFCNYCNDRPLGLQRFKGKKTGDKRS